MAWRLNHEARQALAAFEQAAAHAKADADMKGIGGVPMHDLPRLPVPSPAFRICLPAVESGQPPIAWHPGYGLVEVKRGEADAYAA